MAYQAIGYDKRAAIMHVWDDELGHQKFPFQPYGYLPSDTGKYKTLDGVQLAKVIYSAHKPLSCGARVWIEIDTDNVDVDLIVREGENND